MKILLIRFSSLGDCILLCPLAAYLKSQGAVEVAVVTKRTYAELFSAATGVDRVIAFDPDGGIQGLFRIAADLRRRGFRVIDAHNNWRSRFLSWRMGGADGRFRKHYRQRLGLIVFKRPANLPSILGQYGALAEAAGVPAARLSPGGVEVPERHAAAAAERMHADGHPYVAMAPGARWPMKRWPLEHYLELARRLVREHGYRLLLMGDEADREASAPIAEEIGEMCVDITGRTGIVEGAGYLKHCAGLVANDSGLAHLAEAVGVPVVVLYGPTVESFGYYPSLAGSKTVERKLDCRPCSRNGARPCPRGTQECLTGIGVESVEEAVLELLSKTGRSQYVLPS
jgi:heptosyltransferase-2